MACKYLRQNEYKHLMFGGEIKGENQHAMNMFDCAKYYFDGLFNIVEFPKGMSLYHGSSILTENLIEIPLGFQFEIDQLEKYDKIENPKLLNAVVRTDSDVLEGISELGIEVTPGWFSFYNVANFYAKRRRECDDNCVLAFKLIKDTKFILLQDLHNLLVLGRETYFITNDEDRKEMVDAIKEQFNIDVEDDDIVNESMKHMKYPMTRHFVEIHRYLRYDGMYTIVSLICKYIKKFNLDYAGYAMNDHVLVEELLDDDLDELSLKYDEYSYEYSDEHLDEFPRYIPDQIHYVHHPEFLFCHPEKFLIRDYENPVDWQFFNMYKVPPKTREVLKAMDVFKTTNVGFHQGDLKHHSIWTALNIEKLLNYDRFDKVNFIKYILRKNKEQVNRLSIITGLLHDIGKMFAVNLGDNYNRFIYYYDVPEHPEYGYEVIKGTKVLKLRIPTLSGITKLNEMKVVYFDIIGIMRENDIDVNILFMSSIMFSIHFHRDLGLLPFFKSEKQIKNTVLFYIEEYAKDIRFLSNFFVFNDNFKDMFLFAFGILLTISLGDILGLGLNIYNFNDDNTSSKYFPWLSNVSKRYVGKTMLEIENIFYSALDDAKTLFKKANSISKKTYNNIINSI